MEIINLRKMEIKLSDEEKENLKITLDIINAIADKLDENFFDAITAKDEINGDYYFCINELEQIIKYLNILGVGILTAENGDENNEY